MLRERPSLKIAHPNTKHLALPQLPSKEEAVSVAACFTLLEDSVLALSKFAHNVVPGFNSPIKEFTLLVEQMSEVSSSLQARHEELTELLHEPLQVALPLSSPDVIFNDADSPMPKHPYKAPKTEYATLEHWLYALQKAAWQLQVKCDRYTLYAMTPLNLFTRRPKLIDYGFKIRNAWVYLMIHLSTLISQKQKKVEERLGMGLKRLAVATGQSEFQGLSYII